MDDAIPFTIRTKLTNALGDVEDLATAKGLEQVFAMELFSLRKTVEEALDTDDTDVADKALRDARVLWGLLRGTPGRYTQVGAMA
ncbi:MAG: hypothetical protein P8Y02_01495 [Deinococcales bacterium]